MHLLPPWHKEAKPRARPLQKRTHVAIIGGGITGVSTAYHLARAGVPCVLLEKQAIASGASGKNLGMLTPGTEHDFTEAVGKFGLPRTKAVWHATIDTIRVMRKVYRAHGLMLENPGHLNVALHDSDVDKLKEEQSAMRKAGFSSQFLEGSALTRHVNSPIIRAALRVPYTCLAHPPPALVSTLAAALKGTSATIAEGVQVIHLKPGQRCALQTNAGTLVADRVIIATAGDSPHWVPYELHTRQDFALATKPLPKSWFDEHWPTQELFWNYGVHYHAFRKTPEGRILLSGTEGVTRSFAEFFGPNALEATHRWDCRIASYPDAWPRIGRHPSMRNVFFAGGYRRHGLVLGFLSGKILSNLVQGRKDRWLDLFKP